MENMWSATVHSCSQDTNRNCRNFLVLHLICTLESHSSVYKHCTCLDSVYTGEAEFVMQHSPQCYERRGEESFFSFLVLLLLLFSSSSTSSFFIVLLFLFFSSSSLFLNGLLRVIPPAAPADDIGLHFSGS